ncbi:Hint domain-containing protein [Novacetimonas hansenii]|uniref:Hint domain-containing protein n=2 Tax=Novacetimonas hansenii TaxID=436 RepID=A0AAW5EX53_NOVHA|nr:Hint domain-containing protein [Novacetimonas hansenii]MCJ8354865.1 Hint domain-containing protein [Novacetimonas hansenii]
MANTYTDYKNTKYTTTIDKNGNETSSQAFLIDTNDNSDTSTTASSPLPQNSDGSTTLQVQTLAEANSENTQESDGSSETAYDPGFGTGTQTLELNSIYDNGVNTGFVDATLQSPEGGTVTTVLQQTPYSTSNGTILYAPPQTTNSMDNGKIVDTDQSGGYYTYLTNTAYTTSNDVPSTITATSNGNSFTPATSVPSTPCFTEGTLLLTPRGEVAVEDLRAGDEVVTASGAHRRVRWLGHRRILCTGMPASRRHIAQPVRISAHAIAPNVPTRDVAVSPGHAIAMTLRDGTDVFVPASTLLNGISITQDDRVEVRYWHVELDSHDVLVASGLGSESFMDVGNRHEFAIGAEGLDPQRTPGLIHRHALPFHDEGPVIHELRERLLARAQDMGWRPTQDANLHMMVDGQRIAPVMAGGLTHFTFPATARNVTLHSATFRPAYLEGETGDMRALGVQVRDAWIGDSRTGGGVAIGVDHPLLAPAFHPDERDAECAWRWTTGMARLSPELWNGRSGVITLSLQVNHAAHARWTRPATHAA